MARGAAAVAAAMQQPPSQQASAPCEADLWIIHGEAYDLRAYVRQHPGGPDAISLGQGRDCTELFEQYHVLSSKHLRVLACYKAPAAAAAGLAAAGKQQLKECLLEKGSPHRAESPKSHGSGTASPPSTDGGSDDENNRTGESRGNTQQQQQAAHAVDPFYDDVKAIVRAHAAATGNIKLSAAFVVLHALHIVGLLYSLHLWAQGSLASAFLLPFFLWVHNAAMVHDGGHFALSRRPWVNETLNFVSALITNSTGCWHLQHNVLHHSYTNLVDMDGDLDSHHAYMRIHHEQPLLPLPARLHHGLRAASHLGMYVFAHIGLTMISPYSYFSALLRSGPKGAKAAQDLHTLRRHHAGIVVQLACTLAFYAFPFFRFSFGHAFLLSFFPFFMMSIAFMVFAQVSHIQLDAEGPSQDLKALHWARRMALTSVDYSQDSWLWCYLTIGLNMQSLHHILPGVSYSQLPKLYPAYRAVCAKHGVQLLERRSLWHALCTHVQALWVLSQTHSYGELARKLQ